MAAWRFILGDALGKPIANYSTISKDRALAFRMLRPTAVTMRVPSDHPDVAGIFGDGYPILDSLRRTLFAFRRETVAGSPQWVIRFAGIVWNVQDVGDEGSAWTTFSAYSPLQRLAYRFTATDTADRVGDGGSLLYQMIHDTNRGVYGGGGTGTGGIHFLRKIGSTPDGTYTGIATDGFGNVYETTPSRTVRYDRKNIGDAAIELAGAYNGFDFEIAPYYQAPGTEDGTLGVLNVYARLGSNREDAVFAYDMAPHSASKIERLLDPTNIANAVTGLGGTPLTGGGPITSSATNGSSVYDFGRYEAIDSEPDVVTQDFLDALMLEEAMIRGLPKETVKITPATSEATPDGTKRGRVPVPFEDFGLGDAVPVWASPKLRGGFTGLQRVYGFTIALDDLGVERIDQIIASPNET